MANTSVSYKCPNCGAPLSFQPGKKTVTCEYCNTEFEVAAIEEMFQAQNEMAAATAEAQQSQWDIAGAGENWTPAEISNLHAFTCSSCGAELVCDENTMATECVYCGNPTMIPKRFDGKLKPDYVIPFKKTKADAIAALKNFYKGHYLLPDNFTANNRVEAIQPMYVPFWLFDSQINAQAEFRAKKVRRYDSGNMIVTETKMYNCQRAARMKFEKIPADGSKKMDDMYMESIEPFNYAELVPFSTAYLTGYLADKYDVKAEECAPRADKRVENSAIDVLTSSVKDFNSVEMVKAAVVKDVGKVIYALVPVWILTTRYQDKPYTFMMNGQTGKVVGSLPYDSGKAFKYPAIAALLSMPVIYLLASACM
ncbi:MAG: IBR domain-containing protein [Selenomonadaceae bacterium]|nr:IBR domain-containing protein [Selenomonadaceae bacterium]